MAGKANLRITRHLFSNVLLLSIIFTFGELANGQVSEAEQIALESTSKLLAPASLITIIANHLTKIRAKYPQVADVRHQGKWVPGEVLVGGLDAAGVDQITASRFGPLKEATPLFTTYHLIFSRPYNPEQLAKILVRDYSLEYAEPNGSFGTSQTIQFVQKCATQFQYTFMKGWGDCPAGCINKHFWVFSVSDNNGRVSVKLESEHGSDPDSNPEIEIMK